MSDQIEEVEPTYCEQVRRELPAIQIIFDPERMQVVGLNVNPWFRSNHMLLAVLRMAVDDTEAKLKMQMAIDKQRHLEAEAQANTAALARAKQEAAILEKLHRG